ncbi:MAG: hypothetical protein DMF75_03980 [Acidobacteria bacterium]|nr:MAG: hypothetical protein DMF75_03980 [Acidobacteriota bacterium]
MRNFLRSAMSLLLVATIFSLALAKTPFPAAPAPCQSANNQGKSKIQTLRGDAAKLRIQQLQGKNKALKRALKDMEKIGKTPVWESSGVFDEHPQHAEGFQRQMNRLVRAEQYPFAGV